jgi:hypothetical protein
MLLLQLFVVAGRYYLTPPFDGSWADERLVANVWDQYELWFPRSHTILKFSVPPAASHLTIRPRM